MSSRFLTIPWSSQCIPVFFLIDFNWSYYNNMFYSFYTKVKNNII